MSRIQLSCPSRSNRHTPLSASQTLISRSRPAEMTRVGFRPSPAVAHLSMGGELTQPLGVLAGHLLGVLLRHEQQALDDVRVADQLVQRLLRVQAPDDDGLKPEERAREPKKAHLVVAAAGQQLALLVDAHPPHPVLVLGERVGAEAGGRVPDLDRRVPGCGDQQRLCGECGQRLTDSLLGTNTTEETVWEWPLSVFRQSYESPKSQILIWASAEQLAKARMVDKTNNHLPNRVPEESKHKSWMVLRCALKERSNWPVSRSQI